MAKWLAIGGLLIGLAGVGLAWYFYAKCVQPPAVPISTVINEPPPSDRGDSVIVPPPTGLLSALQKIRLLSDSLTLAGLLSAETRRTLDSVTHVAESLANLPPDTPTVLVERTDSTTHDWMRTHHRYEGRGVTGRDKWWYDFFWDKFPRLTGGGTGLATKSVGWLGFGGGVNRYGAHVGPRMRVSKSLILGVDHYFENRPAGADSSWQSGGWGFEVTYFIK